MTPSNNIHTKFGLSALALSLVIPQLSVCSAELELPTIRRFGRATTIDHQILVFGGGEQAIDVLDTQKETWSRWVPECPASLALYGDQIDDQLYLLDVGSRKLVRFDPQTKTTTKLQDAPTRRINGTVIASGGKLYAIGGYSSDVRKENCVEVYDPKTNRWSNGPPLPGYQHRDHFHSAATLDGKLHVVGGLLAGNKDQPHWRLDGDRWTRRADPPLHAMWKHSAVVAAKNRLYLIAPHPVLPTNQSAKTKDNFYCYDPEQDRWNLVGQAPSSIPGTHTIGAVAGEKIYLMGGWPLNQTHTTRVHVFNIKSGKWSG